MIIPSSSPTSVKLPDEERLGESSCISAGLLPNDLVLTRRGSRVYDLIWDFRDDDPVYRVFNWNADVVSNGLVIGALGRPHFDRLRRPLQEAIAVRWKYRRREDGKPWHAKRVVGMARAARAFACWAAALGINSVEQIDQAVFEAWLGHIEVKKDGTTPRTNRDQKELAEPVLLLWRLRGRLSASLGFIPHSTEAGDWVKGGSAGKSIRLIPKPVLDHLVGAALRYVEVYSHDILHARSYIDGLVRRWKQEIGKTDTIPERSSPVYPRFDAWIGRRFGTRTAPARERMGSLAPWNVDGLFARDPGTGQPWLSGIETRLQLQQLENSLRTSCYIVIAFMTAGRNSELIRLKVTFAPSLNQQKPPDTYGTIVGEVTKHRGRAPKEVTWTVPQVAIQAAGILLRMLASWREKTDSERLFVTQTGGRLNDKLTNTDLKVFLERIDAPYVDGKPFPISSHMLRVALAQWLAQEPYGEIAGAIHLKQLSTAAFRGYLREDPQFQSLFESFGIQAQADHLETVMQEPVVRGRKGSDIVRSRTPEQQAELEANVRSINFAQAGREAPPARTMAKLKKSQRPVYKTKYTMCFFKSDAAECLKGRPVGERGRPLTHRCEPLTCANSAITRLQVPAYLEDFEEYVQLAADTNHSPSQVLLYREQMAELAALIIPFIPVLVSEQALLKDQLETAPAREASTCAQRDRKNEIDNILRRIKAAGIHKVRST